MRCAEVQIETGPGMNAFIRSISPIRGRNPDGSEFQFYPTIYPVTDRARIVFLFDEELCCLDQIMETAQSHALQCDARKILD